MTDSITHSTSDAFFASSIEVEVPTPTFDPTRVLPDDVNKQIHAIYKKASPGTFATACESMLLGNENIMKLLDEAHLLPKYFAYALEFCFMKGWKP